MILRRGLGFRQGCPRRGAELRDAAMSRCEEALAQSDLMMPSLEKQFHKSRAGKLLVLAVVLAAGASAGCGLSTFTSGLGGSVFGGSSNAGADPAKVNDDELLAAARGEGSFTGALGEVSTNCPRVVMPFASC